MQKNQIDVRFAKAVSRRESLLRRVDQTQINDRHIGARKLRGDLFVIASNLSLRPPN